MSWHISSFNSVGTSGPVEENEGNEHVLYHCLKNLDTLLDSTNLRSNTSERLRLMTHLQRVHVKIKNLCRIQPLLDQTHVNHVNFLYVCGECNNKVIFNSSLELKYEAFTEQLDVEVREQRHGKRETERELDRAERDAEYQHETVRKVVEEEARRIGDGEQRRFIDEEERRLRETEERVREEEQRRIIDEEERRVRETEERVREEEQRRSVDEEERRLKETDERVREEEHRKLIDKERRLTETEERVREEEQWRSVDEEERRLKETEERVREEEQRRLVDKEERRLREIEEVKRREEENRHRIKKEEKKVKEQKKCATAEDLNEYRRRKRKRITRRETYIRRKKEEAEIKKEVKQVGHKSQESLEKQYIEEILTKTKSGLAEVKRCIDTMSLQEELFRDVALEIGCNKFGKKDRAAKERILSLTEHERAELKQFQEEKIRERRQEVMKETEVRGERGDHAAGVRTLQHITVHGGRDRGTKVKVGVAKEKAGGDVTQGHGLNRSQNVIVRDDYDFSAEINLSCECFSADREQVARLIRESILREINAVQTLMHVSTYKKSRMSGKEKTKRKMLIKQKCALEKIYETVTVDTIEWEENVPGEDVLVLEEDVEVPAPFAFPEEDAEPGENVDDKTAKPEGGSVCLELLQAIRSQANRRSSDVKAEIVVDLEEVERGYYVNMATLEWMREQRTGRVYKNGLQGSARRHLGHQKPIQQEEWP